MTVRTIVAVGASVTSLVLSACFGIPAKGPQGVLAYRTGPPPANPHDYLRPQIREPRP